jgi:large subunit ribosomal protein L25
MSVLVAEKREGTGKSVTRKLRSAGSIPGVIYGQTKNIDSIQVDAHDLSQLLKEGHTVVELEVDGKKQQAVIKEIQYHPVSGKFLHIDFMRIAKGHEIKITVPIHFEGKPVGVEAGGHFSSIKTELSINVLPRFIPNSIDVDISGLEVGDTIRVKDLNVENMQLLDDPEDVLCHVSTIRVAEEVSAAEEEEGEIEETEEEAEPEVITARKKEDASEE